MKNDDSHRLHALMALVTKNPLFAITLAALAVIALIFHTATHFAPDPSFGSFLLFAGLAVLAFIMITVMFWAAVQKVAP